MKTLVVGLTKMNSIRFGSVCFLFLFFFINFVFVEDNQKAFEFLIGL